MMQRFIAEIPVGSTPAANGSSRSHKSGLAASNSEARRSVKGGAVRVNDRVISDERMGVDNASLQDGAVKLSFGKKRHVLVRPV